MDTKLCHTCEDVKPIIEFFKTETTLFATCKECANVKKRLTKVKHCTTCDVTLDIENFTYREKRRCFESVCLECVKTYKKNQRESNIEKFKEKDRVYHLENKESRNKKCDEYYIKNIVAIKERKKEFYQINKEELLEKQRLKYHTDLSFRLNSSLRRRVRTNLKSGKECMELLGCSIEFLKSWFQFVMDDKNKDDKNEYSFDNYGTYWHIDHVLPCAIFDPSIDAHKEICYHWSNLSPLKISENQSKSNKVDIVSIFYQIKQLNMFLKEKIKTPTFYSKIVGGALGTAYIEKFM